ncbi:MAG: hypothetical protein KIT31_35850 [Deltaproteobacteria bacterium]|nr:hypothetical protein [Deltaproteobacteria bacterium]
MFLVVGACALPEPPAEPPPSLPSCTGELDATFGDGGTVVAGDGEPLLEPLAAAVQADDKIVLAARPYLDGDELVVVRFLPDGRLDPSFGAGGIAAAPVGGGLNTVARAVAIDGGGNVLVAGTVGARAVVARLTAAGALDGTFGIDGVALLAAGVPVAIAPAQAPADGIAVALEHGRIARLDAKGTPDPAFGTGASVGDAGVRGYAVDARGRHLLLSSLRITRLDAGGALDRAFGVRGRAIPSGIIAQPGGRAVIAEDQPALLYALDDDGEDSSYGVGGTVWLPDGVAASAIVAAPDGAVTVAGDHHGHFVAARVSPAGAYERCWATETAIGALRAIAIDSRRRVVLAGITLAGDGTTAARLALVRLAR